MRHLFGGGGEGGGKPRRERGGVTGRQAAAAGGTLVGRVALPQFWEEPSGTGASTGSGESAGSTEVARGWGQHGQEDGAAPGLCCTGICGSCCVFRTLPERMGAKGPGATLESS